MGSSVTGCHSADGLDWDRRRSGPRRVMERGALICRRLLDHVSETLRPAVCRICRPLQMTIPMLRQILNVFENSPGPMSLDVLALQLDLEPAVLEGMLAEWCAWAGWTESTIARKAPAPPAGPRVAVRMCCRTPVCVTSWLISRVRTLDRTLT